jgi:hypothetical protein
MRVVIFTNGFNHEIEVQLRDGDGNVYHLMPFDESKLYDAVAYAKNLQETHSAKYIQLA